jgi:predicted AAA+ superfamily ATPase
MDLGASSNESPFISQSAYQ